MTIPLLNLARRITSLLILTIVWGINKRHFILWACYTKTDKITRSSGFKNTLKFLIFKNLCMGMSLLHSRLFHNKNMRTHLLLSRKGSVIVELIFSALVIMSGTHIQYMRKTSLLFSIIKLKLWISLSLLCILSIQMLPMYMV